jgi:hypothetical protein
MLLSGCGRSGIKHVNIDAKTLSFETLTEMEDFSDLIIEGIRMEQETPDITYENGIRISGYTFSQTEISEIYKGAESMLNAGDNITILENEYYIPEENTTYHVAGYNMMQNGRKYLLFLKGNIHPDGFVYYVAAGVNYGTVALNEDGDSAIQSSLFSDTDSQDESLSYVRPIHEAAMQKYVIE